SRRAAPAGSSLRCSGPRLSGAGRPRAGRRTRSGPDFPRRLHDELELAPLLVLRQRVAVVRAGEAALRREAQVFEGNESGGLVDSPFQLVLAFNNSCL